MSKIKKVELKDAKPYEAPKHFNMVALRLHSRDTTGTQKFWVGLSHFLPGGGAEMDAGPERVYFVLSGTITVIDEEGNRYTLGPMDSIYIPSGVKRRIINETNMPASMLVVVSYPD
ncbi:MAG: cupin domain-containing protein [Thermosphaera sp.]